INECNNNPCKNGATCENLQGSYRCKCKPGFTNNNCQTALLVYMNKGRSLMSLSARLRVKTSLSVPTNSELCRRAGYSYHCKAGYSGINCEIGCLQFKMEDGVHLVRLLGKRLTNMARVMRADNEKVVLGQTMCTFSK
ncbi:unnamed protein product, partial [Porites lobata]